MPKKRLNTLLEMLYLEYKGCIINAPIFSVEKYPKIQNVRFYFILLCFYEELLGITYLGIFVILVNNINR